MQGVRIMAKENLTINEKKSGMGWVSFGKDAMKSLGINPDKHSDKDLKIKVYGLLDLELKKPKKKEEKKKKKAE